MTSVCQKSICIYQDCRNKGFTFTIKGVWDKACSPENQFFTSAIANGRRLSSSKVSLDFDKVLMSYYLYIFSFHQRVPHMTSQIYLILIDILATF